MDDLTRRQESFRSRLRNFAEHMEKSTYPADVESFREVMALQAEALRGLAGNMSQEAGSAAAKMLEQMIELDQRLAGAASTDTVSGVINRQEMERQIEAHTSHGAVFSILIFHLDEPIGDEVLRIVADKLSTLFRYRDRVGRWDAKEFAVLFLGDDELARARGPEAASLLSGRFVLDNGETVLIESHARLLLPEPVAL